MGSQQYCLRWNNHQISVMSVFSKLLQSESLVDVTLACEGSRMKAHKVVLSACSPYFQAIFEENPCQHPVVILKGFCLADLKSVIEFIYKGEVNICQQSLSSFLKTAELLQISGLANAASVTSNAQTEADAYSSENAAERDFGASSCSTPSAPTSLTSSTTAACHTAPPSSRSSRSHKNKHRQHDNGKKSKVTKDTTMQQSASDPCVRSDSTLEEESTEDFTVCNIKKDVEDLESEEMEVSPDMSGMNGSMRHAENSHLYNEPHPVTLHPSTSSEGSNVDWTAATPQAETWIGPESAEHKGSFATEGHGVKEETSSNRMPRPPGPVGSIRSSRRQRISLATKLHILRAHDTRTKTKMELARDFQIGLRTLYKILNQRSKLEEIMQLSGKEKKILADGSPRRGQVH